MPGLYKFDDLARTAKQADRKADRSLLVVKVASLLNNMAFIYRGHFTVPVSQA